MVIYVYDFAADTDYEIKSPVEKTWRKVKSIMTKDDIEKDWR